MPKTLDPNQLQKIDRPFIQPIYFIHLNTHWEYRGNYPNAEHPYDQSQAGHASANKIILNYCGYDNWLSAGICPGDLFNLDLVPGNWGVVASVDSDDQITLVDNYPAMEGSGYTFKRDGTLYLSDRNFTYNGHNYEAYLFDLSGIENQVRNLGGYDNVRVTLKFRNDRIRDYNYLIEFFDDNPVEQRYVEIYKLLIDTGEIFVSDVSTKIFKGEMGSSYEITELAFKIDACRILFGKNAKLPLDVIDLYDFPAADPDDVGKYRNVAIGNIKKLICPWTDAGWLSTLTANIIAGDTSIEVSDATNAPSTPFTTFCDKEEIRVTSKTGNTFTVTRGYGSPPTTPVSHNKGATIYEKKTDFEAEVSMYPVKAIGDIYIKRGSSEWLRLLSGFTKYENTGGRAYIRFSDKPKFEQESDLDVALTDEPHDHDITDMTFTQKECIPDGSSGPTGHANVIDGNPVSYCAIDVDVGVQARFDGESNLGTIHKVLIYVHKLDTAATGYVQSPSGTNLQTLPAPAGLYHIIKTSGALWTDSVVIIGGAGGNQIAEIYKVVEYTPNPNVTNTQLDPYLYGNSVANMVIGDVVACDVEGCPDDDLGTYTGTPDTNPLIERPDHVRKFILMALLGFSATDIDASFATIGAIYGTRISGGYKFAFNLPDVAKETMDLFRKMDEQTRSVMFESQGKFKLAFSPTSSPTSQITFGNDNDPDHYKTKGDFIFGKTDAVDIRNKIRGRYFRDYTKSGSLGDKYQKVEEVSNWVSVSKYGEIAEDIEFDCIGDLVLMVNDVIDWILAEKSEVKKTVEFPAFWDAMILENCDYFTVISNFWSGHKFRALRLTESDDRKIIEIEGLEYVA